MSGRDRLLVGGGFAAGLVVAGAIALLVGGADGATDGRASATTATTAERIGSAPPEATPAPAYLAAGGPEQALHAFRARFGEVVRFREIVFYPGYVIAEVVNPAKPDELDRHVLRGGKWDADPAPVRVSPRENLAETTFTNGLLKPSVIAAVAARAPTETGITDGQVTHLIIRRQPNGERVELSTYVSTERRSAFLVTDTEGKTLRGTRG